MATQAMELTLKVELTMKMGSRGDAGAMRHRLTLRLEELGNWTLHGAQ